MIRSAVVRPCVLVVLGLAVLLAGCSSVAGTPQTAPGGPAIGTSTGSRSSTPSDPTAELLELHYLRSTIAGRQSEHTAAVRADGEVVVTDEVNGSAQSFTLTGEELRQVGELLPVLAQAPAPTSVVTDVGRIDARFTVGGRDVTVSVDDWSMAGGTTRLPADEREVADAMIELRDLLIRISGASTSPTPTPTG